MNEPTKILVYAEQSIIETCLPYIDNDYNVLMANDQAEVEEKLDNSCTVLLIHEDQIQGDTVFKLEEFRSKVQATRIAMIQSQLDQKTILKLFNKKIVDYVVLDIEEELRGILQSAVGEYNRGVIRTNQDTVIKDRLKKMTDTIITEDNLLNLSMELSDTKEIKDFSNQFLAMIEGLQSFISVYFSINEGSSEKDYRETIFNYLTDVELLANQYDQKILMIYIEALRAYLHLLFADVDTAMYHYQNCIRIFYWISDEYLDEEIVEIVNSFPIRKDEYYYISKGEREFNLDLKMKLKIRNNLNRLLKYNISNLINLTKQFYQNLHIEDNVIQTIMVVRNSLPLYIFDEKLEDMDPVLVTGFVEALSSFLQELTSGAGDIDKISHDRGTILIHKEEGLRFLLVASRDELYLRMGLRQFAKKTIKELQVIPLNDEASEEQYERFTEIINNLFDSKKTS